MSEPLFEIEQELRNAVQCSNYDGLPQQLEHYCRTAESLARTMAPGGSDLPKLAARVLELLQWSRLMLVTTRSSWAAELSRFPMLGKYLSVSGDCHTALQVDA